MVRTLSIRNEGPGYSVARMPRLALIPAGIQRKCLGKLSVAPNLGERGSDVRGRTAVAYDASLIEPHLRFQLGGSEVDMANRTPTWNVETARDVELPIGEWNTLDLYVVGNRAVHVVNGVPVAQVWDMATLAPDGSRVPLTHGKIQLQSEGAETWFRDITIQPIATLPRIVAE